MFPAAYKVTSGGAILSFLLSAITGHQGRTYSPFDDYWYHPRVAPAVTGHRVTPELAMSVSTVYAAVRVRSTVLAMLPLQLFRRLPDGRGKERAHDHRLSYLLHHQPNRWQTSFQWRQMLQAHVILRGNGYSEIVAGPRGFADQLIPLHPAFVVVKDQLTDGRLVYEYRPPDQPGVVRLLSSDQIFHVIGPSDNGITGLSVVALMRNSVGLALALQEHGGRQFGGNSPMMKGIIKQTTPRPMDEAAQKVLTRSFAAAHSGQNAHGVAYLPPGLEWQSVGMTNDDAQFLATQAFQVEDLLRFLSVPGNLVGHADKTATFASAEAFFQSFLTIHMDPDFVMWEQAISRDLLFAEEQETVFAQFNRASLLRGDHKARSEFYRAMVELGIMTRNETRELENLNALDGLDGPLTPLNMQQGGQGGAVQSAEALAPQMHSIVTAAAERLIRKECAVVTKAAEKHADDTVAWMTAAATFYEKFRDELVTVLALSTVIASAYCSGAMERLKADGMEALETWRTPEHLARVVGLAMVNDPVAQLQQQIGAVRRDVETLAERPAPRERRTRFERDEKTHLITSVIEDSDGEAPTIQ